MKTTLQILSVFAVFAAHGQGVVYFVNDSFTLTSPPDRLIRFATADTPGNPFGTNNAPAVGTNFLVQLYYGSLTTSEGSLVPVSYAPAFLRPSTTSIPGVWARGGDRTLAGIGPGTTVLLQVRVWDYFDGQTYEEAISQNPFGVSGKSLVFPYDINPSPVPEVEPMRNFQGFIIAVPEPSITSLFFLGFAALLLKVYRRARTIPIRKDRSAIRPISSRSLWYGLVGLLLAWTWTASAQTNDPVPVRPRTILSNGLYGINISAKVPVPFGPKPLIASPQPSLTFDSSQGVGAVPDTDGAAGIDHIMTMLNDNETGGGVRIQTRAGTSVFTNTLRGWWGFPSAAVHSAFDPRVIYDPYHSRWIAVAGGWLPDKTNSYLLFGVSLTSNPTNGWNLLSVRADSSSTHWIDYPTVGFNKHWIVVQANMIAFGTNNEGRSSFWVFNKTNVYAGGSNYTTLTHTNPAGGFTALSEVPAITYDTNLSKLYLLQSANGTNAAYGTNGGVLRLFTISGPVGDPRLNNDTNYAMGTPWAAWMLQQEFLPQKGTNSPKVKTPSDDRLTSVVYRGKSLWAVQTIMLPTTNPTRTAVQWWELRPDPADVNPNPPTIIQQERIDDSIGSTNYAFPSLAVNRFGDILIGHNAFSTNQYPCASYSFKAFNSEMGTSRVYQSSPDVFFGINSTRWGDYSMTCVDPRNDADFWTVQEYSVTNIYFDPEFWSIWGTSWAQVKVEIPTNDNFSSSLMLTGAQGTTNGTNVRALNESDEPNHVGNTNTASVWYSWTAPTNGDVRLTLMNVYFDSLLAVYTGTAVTNLTVVASNHGGFSGSEVLFNAAMDTTYRIVVDAFGSSPDNYGNFALDWNQPAFPLFVQQPRGWDVYMGTNVTFSGRAIGRPNPDYQWRSNGTNIFGATSSSYTKNNVQTNDTGNFTLVASNTSGSATSQVAHLEVYSTQKALITEPSVNTNRVRFIVSGITGCSYVVEASTNLISWVPINTNVTTFTNLDYDVTNFRSRFYRVLYQP